MPPGGGKSRSQRLARTVTGTDGSFAMSFREPASEDSVLYLVAERQAVALATVLGHRRWRRIR